MDCDGRYPEFLKSRGVWNLFVFPYNFAELSVYISWAFLVKFSFASVSIKKMDKKIGCFTIFGHQLASQIKTITKTSF